MNTQHQTIENFNELVFENRNKAYGAYILRKGYSSNVSFSLLLSIVFFGLIALAAMAFTKSNVPPLTKKDFVVNKDSVFVMTIELPRPEPKTMEPKKKVEVLKPHSNNVNPVVTDKKPDTNLKTNVQLVNNKPGTAEGKDSVAKTDIISDGIIKKKPEVPTTPVYNASEMPEFKGNLFQYLADNLHYPRMAVEAGTEGQVYLTFVIEKDGGVDEVKILKGLADGCTEEAIRVVQGMPKWKPGKNHDEPVRVQFNLPIKFRLK